MLAVLYIFCFRFKLLLTSVWSCIARSSRVCPFGWLSVSLYLGSIAACGIALIKVCCIVIRQLLRIHDEVETKPSFGWMFQTWEMMIFAEREQHLNVGVLRLVRYTTVGLWTSYPCVRALAQLGFLDFRTEDKM